MVSKKELLYHLIKNMSRDKCYASFLAFKIKSNVQYACQLLGQLKLERKIKIIEGPFSIGQAGRNLKIYYGIRGSALDEVKEVLGIKKAKKKKK